jgi:hypothetical protein
MRTPQRRTWIRPASSSAASEASGSAGIPRADGPRKTLSNSHFAQAAAVNQLGEMTGRDSGPNGFRGVFWASAGAQPVELRALGGGNSGAFADDLDDRGHIVGSALKYDAGGYTLGTRAILWNRQGDPTELPDLDTRDIGYAWTRAHAINAAGTIVGMSAKYTGGNGYRAVIWESPTSIAELTPLALSSDGTTTDEALGHQRRKRYCRRVPGTRREHVFGHARGAVGVTGPIARPQSTD